MEASKKSPLIDALLNELLSQNRMDAIESDVCVGCGREALLFKDAISKKEYSISGLCQTCQDKIFH